LGGKDKMADSPQPEWKPIEFLPTCLTILRGILDSNGEQYDALSKARHKPYVLDDQTLQRSLKLFNEQKEFFWVWEEQIDRWSKLDLNAFQYNMIQELKDILREIKISNAKILDLVQELESRTIDRMLAKGEDELAMEFFSSIGQNAGLPDGIEKTITGTIDRMAEFENKYQTQKEILEVIFSRFTPSMPAGAAEACARKVGVKIPQLQNPALRSMFLDYCLFYYKNQGKTLAAEFMDQCIEHLSNAETLALYDFQKAAFFVLEVKGILMGSGIAVYDLLHDEIMILFDEELIGDVCPGCLIVCHVVRSAGVAFTSGAAIVIRANTLCGRLIRQEISGAKNNLQDFDPENYATKILEITYKNILK
jgi:hypothetical protein